MDNRNWLKSALTMKNTVGNGIVFIGGYQFDRHAGAGILTNKFFINNG